MQPFQCTKAELKMMFNDKMEDERKKQIHRVCIFILEEAEKGKLSCVISLNVQVWVGTAYDMTSEEVIERIKEYFPDCDYSLSEGNLTVSWK